MQPWHFVALFAAGVLAVIAIGSCGGGDPEEVTIVPTDTTASASSKSDFIEDADALCEAVNTQIAQFAAAGQGLTEAEEIADLRSSLVRDIKDLGPPSEDRAVLDQVLTGYQAQAQAGEKLALASDRGEDTLQFESELDAAQADTAAAASEYGFQECGQEPTASGSGTTNGGTAVPSAPVAPAPAVPEAPAPPDPVPPDGGGVTPGGGVSP